MTIVLNIGHGMAIRGTGFAHDPGAVNPAHNITEWQLCEKFTSDLVRRLRSAGVVYHYTHSIPRPCPVPNFCEEYQRWTEPDASSDLVLHVVANHWDALPTHINALRPDLCISFHVNSFGQAIATGSQVNYWHTSTKGRKLAQLAMDANSALGLAKRVDGSGLLAQSAGRGAKLLTDTTCPTIINEPFFLSNPNDLATYHARYKAYLQAWFQTLLALTKYPL
jgi:N-acetylmuramoyl-L-alanine amidase